MEGPLAIEEAPHSADGRQDLGRLGRDSERQYAGVLLRASIESPRLRYTAAPRYDDDWTADRMCILRQCDVSEWSGATLNLKAPLRGQTITIDSAMGAGLFAVAFDFLPSALVAGTRYPPPLLHWRYRGLWGALIRLIVVAR